VTIVYDPPKPGDTWAKDTLFPPGSVITPTEGTAHYFMTDNGGQSGGSEPDWSSATAPNPKDSDCSWTWIGATGSTLPQQFQNKQKLWIAGASYQSGDIIQGPGSTQQFIMNKCTSAFVTASPGGAVAAPGAACPAAGAPLPVQQCIAGATFSTGVVPAGGALNSWNPAWNLARKVPDNLLDSLSEPPVTLDGTAAAGVFWRPVENETIPGKCSDFPRKPSTAYGLKSFVCVPGDKKTPDAWYYSKGGGTSGSTTLTFNATGFSWQLTSDKAVTCRLPGAPAPIQQHQAITLYHNGDPMCESPSTIYTAVISSKAGEFSGDQDPLRIEAEPLSWYDVGPAPPSSVTGLLASEQTLSSLPSITLPQSHSRFSFNVASGLLVTTLRTKTFGYAPTATSNTANSGNVVQTGSTLLIDPVASLTKYFVAFDAEKKWSPKDLVPGLTVSFSLSAPTNNFYVGGSTEFARYLQLEMGYVAARLPQPATGSYVSTSSTTPPTNMVFHSGAYIGISFDISGLISGMGGSSGGGSSSGSGKGGGASSAAPQ
jgi:hypothetical protein